MIQIIGSLLNSTGLVFMRQSIMEKTWEIGEAPHIINSELFANTDSLHQEINSAVLFIRQSNYIHKKMIQIRVKTCDEKCFLVDIIETGTLREFQEKLESLTLIDICEQKIVSAGRFIKTDEDFEKVKRQETPHIQITKSVKMPENSSMVTDDVPLIVKKFEMAWILMLNVEACIRAFHGKIHPTKRQQYSLPEGLILQYQSKPCAEDFAKLTERVAKIYENQADISEICGKLVASEVGDIEIQKNQIQLMMDSSRYLAVLNSTMANIIIPLRHQPPRFLAYKQNPVARARR